jgi:cbb3-type cytochrome oxidase maturation protein
VSILYVLVPLSVVLMAGAAWALFWAIDSGQFDDAGEVGRSIRRQTCISEGGGATKRIPRCVFCTRLAK